MKTYDALVFDLDGTLLDSKKDIAVATNETIAHMGGQRLSEALIATYVGRGVRDLIRQALHDVPGPKGEEAALAFFSQFYLDHCLDHSRLFAGVRETLEALYYAGLPLAVFTNKPQEYTDKILAGLDLTHFFVMMLGSDSGFPNKPAREGGLAIQDKLGVAPARTLMVGDSIVDLQTAENLGWDAALYLDGFSERAEIESYRGRATFIYDDFTFLKRFIPIKEP